MQSYALGVVDRLMPKVVISGYYGFRNSGDEAMLHAMLLALRDTVPNFEATVLSGDPEFTAREFGVPAVVRDNPRQVFNALRRSDLLISGGGGLLQDVTGPNSIIYYLGIAAMARLLGKPVFFYAQGIGPINTAMGKQLTRIIANRVNLITVRDQDSKDELVSMGVNRPPIHVTADPVLGLEPSGISVQKGREILSSLGITEGPVAGISVRPWKGLSGFKQVLARVADDLVSGGWKVLLVPMQPPGDVKACREVAGLMRGPSFILDAGVDYKELLAVTANLDLAIGMRLHFLIFSAIFGVPLVGVPYDPKVNRFLQSVGHAPGFNAENVNYAQLSERIHQVLSKREQVSSGLRDIISTLRQDALKNALLVSELFHGQ